MATQRITRKLVLYLTNEEIIELYNAIVDRVNMVSSAGPGQYGTAINRYVAVLSGIKAEIDDAAIEASDAMKKQRIKRR